MMSNWLFCKASINDVDLLYKIDIDYEYERYSKKLISDSLASDTCLTYIGYCDNNPIGYISVNKVCDEIEILKIVILKEYRCRGYGTRMIKELLESIKQSDVKNVFLEVRANNIPAKKLYEKNGFVKINQRLKYYEDGEDADIYRLSFYE